MTSAVEFRPSRRAAALKLALLAAVVVATLAVAYSLRWFEARAVVRVAELLRRGRDVEGAAPLFVLVYAAATAVVIPGTPLTVIGGAIFGSGVGILLSWAGAMIGAVVGYWLGRFVGRDTVRRFLRSHEALLGRVEDLNGFTPLLRLRLIPVMPLGVLNVASGLTGMNFRAYLGATAVGIVPMIVVFAYFADSVLGHAAGARENALAHLAVASALLLVLSFAPTVAHRLEARRAAEPPPGDEPTPAGDRPAPETPVRRARRSAVSRLSR